MRQIDEATLDDVEDLYAYWNQCPPVHEILAAVHKIQHHTGTSVPGYATPAMSTDRAEAVGELLAMGVTATKQELPLQKYSRWKRPDKAA